jgi:hypothetical protein
LDHWVAIATAASAKDRRNGETKTPQTTKMMTSACEPEAA